MKAHLVIIDPQNDFMGLDDGTPLSVTTTDGTTFTAALPVKGGKTPIFHTLSAPETESCFS